MSTFNKHYIHTCINISLTYRRLGTLRDELAKRQYLCFGLVKTKAVPVFWIGEDKGSTCFVLVKTKAVPVFWIGEDKGSTCFVLVKTKAVPVFCIGEDKGSTCVLYW